MANSQRTSLLVAVAVLVTVVACSTAFAVGITASLRHFAGLLEKVAFMQVDELDLGAPPKLKEIRDMHICFVQTVHNLVQLKQYMPDSLFAQANAHAQSPAATTPTPAVAITPAWRHSPASRHSSMASSCFEEHLERGPRLPAGMRRRVISLLVTDLNHFNQEVETLPLGDFTQSYGAYLSAVVAAVRENGGVVDRFMGDKVVCHWNAALLQVQHCFMACNAGHAIISHLTQEIRIGIASGEALIGTVGSTNLKSFQVVGRTVNTAFLLAQHCKATKTSMLTNAAVHRAVNLTSPTRLIDIIPDHNGQPMEVFEILPAAPHDGEWMYSLDAQWKNSSTNVLVEEAVKCLVKGDSDAAFKHIHAYLEANPDDLPAQALKERICAVKPMVVQEVHA